MQPHTKVESDLTVGAWRHWFVLSGTTAISTIGLSSSLYAVVRGYGVALWPWPHTETALLASLSVLILVLVAYLTLQRHSHLRSLRVASEETRREIAQREWADRRLSLVKDTLDNVSHEFRTPLTVIKEYAAGVRDNLMGHPDTEVHEFLNVIISCVDDLAVMVNDMLDVSRIEANIVCMSRRRYRLGDIVRRLRRPLERKAQNNGIELEVLVDEDCPELFCDADKIGRVIINLTVNAIKFSPRGGKVRLSARHEPNESQVRVAVSDEGPGIPLDQRERIFERFQRLPREAHTSTSGFGLGLNIAKELVELSFGDMHVESEVGLGSVFSFTVPTPEPVALLRRYLGRVERFRESAEHFTVVSVSADQNIDPDQWADLERFLETQVRRSDLLLKTRGNGWLLVAAADEQGTNALVGRLTEAYRRANPELAALSTVALNVLGTWRSSDQCELLIAHFTAAYHDVHLPTRDVSLGTERGEGSSAPLRA